MLAFLGDVSISQTMLQLARQAGYPAQHVRDVGLLTATDSAILAYAAAHEQIVLTLDVGFAREAAFAPYAVPGVILFRLGNVTTKVLADAFARVLQQFPAEVLQGYFVVVEPKRIRRRTLPLRS